MSTTDNNTIFSQQDIIDSVKNWKKENSEETTEIVIYFVSELTGLSADQIIDDI